MRVRRHQDPSEPIQVPLPGRRVILAAAVLLGAVALGLLAAALLFVPGDALQGDARVPAVVGLSEEDAVARLEEAGFRPRTQEGEPSPVTPAGAIAWQDPPAGLRLPAGSVVQLVRSTGPEQVVVPEVTGLDEALAREVLAAAGVPVAQVDTSAANVARGVVVTTRPSAGTARPAGSGVTLVLSRGPADRTVPRLAGVTIGEARARLESAGLRVGAVRPAGTGDAVVTSQRPQAGSRVAAGTAVDLNVRSGS